MRRRHDRGAITMRCWRNDDEGIMRLATLRCTRTAQNRPLSLPTWFDNNGSRLPDGDFEKNLKVWMGEITFSSFREKKLVTWKRLPRTATDPKYFFIISVVNFNQQHQWDQTGKRKCVETREAKFVSASWFRKTLGSRNGLMESGRTKSEVFLSFFGNNELGLPEGQSEKR